MELDPAEISFHLKRRLHLRISHAKFAAIFAAIIAPAFTLNVNIVRRFSVRFSLQLRRTLRGEVLWGYQIEAEKGG